MSTDVDTNNIRAQIRSMLVIKYRLIFSKYASMLVKIARKKMIIVDIAVIIPCAQYLLNNKQDKKGLRRKWWMVSLNREAQI